MAFNRAESPLRWLMLVLACVAMFGPYYVYDNPTALKKTLTSDLDITQEEYNWLYSIYSLPNIILPFFGGTLVDKYGTNVTLFSFLTLICIGQGVFALGVARESYPLALVGRGIFGFGGESMSVASSALLALWFKGSEVALAMGVNIAVARLGSVVNDNLSDYMNNHHGLNAALWLGFFICICSLGATLALIFVERNAAKNAADSEREKLLANGGSAEDLAAKEEEAPKETVSCTDVKEFNRSYWLLCASCVVVYAAVIPYNNIAGGLIQDKYGFSSSKANAALGVPYLVSAFLSPFLGGVVDYWGKRAILLTVSAIFLTLAHLTIGFTDITVWVPQCIIGLSYSVYAAAVWPSVSYVVKESQLGTAYGVITAIQNGGLLLGPVFVGLIQGSTCKHIMITKDGKPKKYCKCVPKCVHETEAFFALIGFVGVLIGFWLNYEDRQNGNILNDTKKSGKKEDKEQSDAQNAVTRPLFDSDASPVPSKPMRNVVHPTGKINGSAPDL